MNPPEGPCISLTEKELIYIREEEFRKNKEWPECNPVVNVYFYSNREGETICSLVLETQGSPFEYFSKEEVKSRVKTYEWDE